MSDDRNDQLSRLAGAWRRWGQTASTLDERQVAVHVREGISGTRSRLVRPAVLVAATASLVVGVIAVDWLRQPSPTEPAVTSSPVHDAGRGVILILREGNTPIYVLTDSATESRGEER